MPVYDYTCSACGHLTEVIHGIHDDGPRFCPACGAEGGMRKGFATPAVHFKGSGWARKDRSSAKRPAGAPAAAADAPATGEGATATPAAASSSAEGD